MTRSRSPWLKICGITSPEDAELAVRAGADALGLNFVPGTKRFLGSDDARAIVQAVRGRVELIGVFADQSAETLLEARERIGLDWLQLHGDEPPELVARLPKAFKAMSVAQRADLERALAYPGERLLLDAKVEGQRGGTGVCFEWSLLEGLADRSRLIVAGGLRPDNVAELVRRVSPFGVDVASGVEMEGAPRRKDPKKVVEFVARARAASGDDSLP